MQAALTHDKLTRVHQLARAITDEVGRAYIGSPQTTEALLVALLARGHVLIEGYPGVAKTTLVKAFSATLGCHFRRIQFTPDLLPSDITGTYILDMRTNTFVLREGPVFTNVLLGDEINRAPAKTQSALLEAMQEQQVTIEGETRALGEPFIVLATQNPIEQEGTYPLPEAQVDRFLIKLKMGYPAPSRREAHARRRTTRRRRRRARSSGRPRCSRCKRSRRTSTSPKSSSTTCSASSRSRAATRAPISALRRAPASRSFTRRRASRCCAAATTCCPTTFATSRRWFSATAS